MLGVAFIEVLYFYPVDRPALKKVAKDQYKKNISFAWNAVKFGRGRDVVLQMWLTAGSTGSLQCGPQF